MVGVVAFPLELLAVMYNLGKSIDGVVVVVVESIVLYSVTWGSPETTRRVWRGGEGNCAVLRDRARER